MLVGTNDWLNGYCSSDPRSLDFPCGSSRILCLREDILDMEDAARHFELDKDDGYVPYCEINFDWTDDSVEKITYEETPNASAPVASDLDYSIEPKYNLDSSNTQVLKFFQVNSGSMAFLRQ
ncbi:hypothetical protein FXO38_14412 [Capsicum annuum]|uniref:Uncharacterized protein n=1 Tax=Capsicum annuum TaxID=4072 RepID=A0A2G2Y2W4_CAPAN|nr:hypothetical protein FXO38_14412 [Capsicum annuum]KAF3676339.1 hypothetical protein FXO37_05397 [Capsicum annuum]PHT64049.1 hypothetical protein T459_32150 [Capsicum annuum]